MDRHDLEKLNKNDLLAKAQAMSLAATPAMQKKDLVELIIAADAMAAASAPTPAPAAPAPSVNLADAQAARIAELEAQLAAANAAPAAAPAIAPVVAAKMAEDERNNPLPREGQLRTLDGKLVDFKRVRVTILATENEREDVKLGLNGHLLQIKRGVPVEIPHHYLDVLKNSTIDTFTKDPETGVLQRVQIQRYPYQVEFLG